MTITDKNMAAVLDGVDKNVRPQDDLFRAINGTWLRESEIPADLSSSGSFMDLVVQAEADVAKIIDDLGSSNPTEGEAAQIARIYRSWMDTDAVNAKGLSPLQPDIDLVESATTKDELASVVGRLKRSGVGSFFSLDVDSDLNDPNRYVIHIGQSGIGLPDEAYYREPQFADILEKYQEFLRSFHQLFGLSADEASARADVVFGLEKAIASRHMNVVDSRDTDKINNLMSWEAFTASTPGFAWDKAFTSAGFTPEQLEGDLLVYNPDALAGAASLWAESSLEDLKAYTLWRVFRARSTFLTEEIDAANFEFYGRTLSGTAEQRERWKRGVQLINGSLGEAVGKLYVEKHFPPENKAKMRALVEDLLEAYRRSIRNLDWMGEDTKVKALEKVDSFDLKIGYPDKWIDYSSLVIGDDLVENIRQINAFEFDRALNKLGKPVDRSEWFMSPQTVNAYYNPVWNEIVFPAAILQFPFFDPDRDDALNYGGIGSVIGHEIGHGFDDQGSKYAADGSLSNWWTDQDRAEFEKRTQALVAQYDAYIPEQLDGDSAHHVQGALTLGENIGDLGGLSIALKAYGISLERAGLSIDKAPEIDGYTGTQRVFISYARVWQGKRRTEFLKTLIATDPHSPAEFRCNGVVKNIDAFAEAFDVKEGDALYLPPEERVRIWS
ncbi:peptidase M13 [Arcanobacterium haemolyticum]|nr:peptidase M13 [Arcanobacterium haemolyticum]